MAVICSAARILLSLATVSVLLAMTWVVLPVCFSREPIYSVALDFCKGESYHPVSSLFFSGAMSQEASGLLAGEEFMHWKGITADSVGLGLPRLLLGIAKNISP